MDESGLDRLYRCHHRPLWRALAARFGDPRAADRALIAATSHLRTTMGEVDEAGSVVEVTGRAEWWSAAFDEIEADPSVPALPSTVPSTPSSPLPWAVPFASTTTPMSAEPRADIDDPGTSPRSGPDDVVAEQAGQDPGLTVLDSPTLFELADGLGSSSDLDARLLLGHHVGGLPPPELARLAKIAPDEVEHRLASAEADVGGSADMSMGPPHDRWAEALEQVEVPDLRPEIGLDADRRRSLIVLGALGSAALVLGVAMLFGIGRTGATTPTDPARFADGTDADRAGTPDGAADDSAADEAGAAGVGGEDESAGRATVEMSLLDRGDGGREGGARLPDGRRFWLRLPEEFRAESVSVTTDESRPELLLVQGADLFMTVTPGPCPSTLRSAPAVAGSVASVTVGAVPLCFGSGDLDDLVLNVYMEELESPAQLGRIEAALFGLDEPTFGRGFDPENVPDGVMVRDVGTGRVIGVDGQIVRRRWSYPPSGAGRLVASGQERLLVAVGAGLASVDPVTGRERWQTGAGVVEQVLFGSGDVGPSWYSVEEETQALMVARDDSTGETRWVVPVPAGRSRELIQAGPPVVALDRLDDSPLWSMFAVDPGSGEELWRVDGGAPGSDSTPGPEPALRPIRAVSDEDRDIIMVLTSHQLLRVDGGDGRIRWRTDVNRDPDLALGGIWPNTVTLEHPDRRITVGLTEGYVLPP